MAAQGYAHGLLGAPFAIGRRSVEVVHAMLQRGIHQPVYLLLVDNIVGGVFRVGYGGPAHTSVAEERHLVALRWIRAIGHLVGGNRGLRQILIRSDRCILLVAAA